ncbi:PQQ-binding-like beta-propeller repeat protein [Longispora sp. K20-0274]|uniref:outer membrane protein assembly factor BamB family protein n=1 Tax=Longispora sp. K20-0274 TaxID=3088255 RepID=UPI00399B9AC2
MGFIDLGQVTRADARPGPEPWTRWRRRALALGVAAVTLLTCGAAETVRGSPLREVFSVPTGAHGRSDQQLVLDGDTLFRVYREGASTYLARHDLAAHGRLTWRVPVDASVVGSLVLEGRLLLVQQYADVTKDPAPTTMAFDAGTGAPLWTIRGFLYAGLGGEKGLISQGSEMVGIELATGRELWRRPQPGGGAALVGGSAPVAPWRIATTEGSTLRVLDLETGAVLRSRDIGPDQGPERFGGVFATPDALVLRRGPTYTTYDPDTLEQLWTSASAQVAWAMPCARLLCEMTGRDVVAVDVRTGERRWTSPVEGLYLSGMGLVGPRGGGTRLIDTATGRQLLDLGRWVPLPGRETLRGEPAPADRIAVSAIFDGVDWVGVADLRAGRIRPLAPVKGAGDERCVASAKYLVCTLISEKLTGWTF